MSSREISPSSTATTPVPPLARQGREGTRTWGRALIVAGAATTLTVLLAPPANAHGVPGDASHLDVPGFIPLGAEHMLLGWDHLLFILGVVIIGGTLHRAAELISIFVIGHSSTLIVATVMGWRVNAGLIDTIIALSVVFVGVVILRVGRPESYRWFSITVLGFGLVHGLGLATRFDDLNLPDQQKIVKLLAFNAGIEIGQILAVAVMITVLRLVGRGLEAEQRSLGRQRAGGLLVIIGAIAALVMATSTIIGTPQAPAVALPVDTSCSIESSELPDTSSGGHPPKSFYEPEETTPVDDFDHALGDRFLVVYYDGEQLGDDDRAELRAMLSESIERRSQNDILAGPATSLSGLLQARTHNTTMTCTNYETASVEAFLTSWEQSVS